MITSYASPHRASQSESLFPTDLASIIQRVDEIDPIGYGRSRNFIDGAVTRLSPYISRGVISTRFVLDRTLARGFEPYQIEKFIKELAWRDYYQRVWQAKGDAINSDLRHPQANVANHRMPGSVIAAETGIDAVDAAIRSLYSTGYMHNHIRMYTASITCNIGRSHWLTPARWMYYHLLDGDWASNAISWQWVAGAASTKKYFADQANVDRHCYTSQSETFLDVAYDEFGSLPVPAVLQQTITPTLTTVLPERVDVTLDPLLPTLIYNSYNLDPTWKSDTGYNRVLLLEPSHFAAYPIAANVLEFILALGRHISGLQIFVGEFSELKEILGGGEIYYKEHPLNRHYTGTEESRDWMFSATGYYPSFFGFWKKCESELKGSQLSLDL